jgi:hypothetical protein
MRKYLICAALLLGTIILCGRVLPAFAADEASPAPPPAAAEKADKPEAAKGEEGGDASKEGGKAEGAKKKGPGDVSGGRFAGDPIYVHLTPMTLPIISESGVEQLVTIQMTVEVKDLDVADDMHIKMPKVLDALNRVLYGGLGDGSARNGRLVDVNKIKSKAIAVLKETVGADSIKDVLIVNVSQRML